MLPPFACTGILTNWSKTTAKPTNIAVSQISWIEYFIPSKNFYVNNNPIKHVRTITMIENNVEISKSSNASLVL